MPANTLVILVESVLKSIHSHAICWQISQEKREQAVYQFNAPDSPHFVFLLGMLPCGFYPSPGALFVSELADTVIIFDSDWNPLMDMARPARTARQYRTPRMRQVNLSHLVLLQNIDSKSCTG